MSAPVTPVAGCSRTLAAIVAAGGGSLYLAAHLIVWAVTSW